MSVHLVHALKKKNRFSSFFSYHSFRRRFLRLLEEGASPEARCRVSLTSACHVAAALGALDVLTALLDSRPGASKARDREGRQPHHLAAGADKLSCLQHILCNDPTLVASSIQPNIKEDIPPGSLDSWNHDHHQLQVLVPEARGLGVTALHLAAERCLPEMVEFLLALGAEPNTPDMSGLTPLDVAGQNPVLTRSLADYSKIVSGYITVGFSERDSQERSSSQTVCSLLIDSGAKMPSAKVIVKDGVVINQSRKHVTALHTAVLQKDVALTEYLLRKGACLTTWNSEGETAVHLAVRQRAEEVLRVLVAEERESVVGARDVLGRTPLLQAVEDGWADGVALLLEAGADVCVSSNSNQTVLHLAARHGRATILEELLSIQEINRVLERTNSSYETPLCLAVKMSEVECVKLLCKQGADSNFLLLPGDQSLLHLAVMNDSVEILQCLLAGAGKTRINLKNKEEKGGLTPLHIAAKEGHTDCAEELLGMGADSRLTTKSGDYALHLACREGHIGVVRLLIKQDPGLFELRNADGWNPLHVAAAATNADCVREMVLHGADLAASIKVEIAEKTGIDIICSSIPKSAEFLEDILNDHLEVLKGPVNSPDCEIILNFDVLMPHGEDEKQLKVIGAIMNSGRRTMQERLMLHPLIECFLHLKWKRFNCLFIFMMVLYLILTLAITTLAHITFIEKTRTTLTQVVAIISRVVLCTVLVPIFFVELVNLSQLQRYYFMDYESWVKWTVICFTCMIESFSPNLLWIRYMASIAVLLAWVELLFLLSRCPTWGFYVLMFSKVAVKTLKVLATFSLLIIGFAFSFLILFQAQIPFRNMLEAVVKVIVMMVEFDYEDMFSNVSDGSFSVIARLLFTVFVLLVALVMMNLIVGVAVSDISRLEEQGRTEQLVKQASFLGFLEMLLYSSMFKGLPKSWRKGLESRRAVHRSVLVKPGRPSSAQIPLPRSLVENIIFNIKTRQVRSENISASLHELSGRIDNIAGALRDFYTNQQTGHMIKNDKQFDYILKLILDEQRQLREQLKTHGVVKTSFTYQPDKPVYQWI